VELGEVAEAAAVLARHRVDRLIDQRRPTRSVLLAARATVRVAAGADGGIADYLACGRELALSGISNPAVLAWQGPAALAAKGTEMAGRLATQELAAARRWGAPRALGRALYASALVHDDATAVDKLAEAADLLELAMTHTYLVHVLLELGTRLAARGDLPAAQAKLRRALDLASQCGNGHRAAQVRRAMARLSPATGPRPALNQHESRVAELARAGDTTKQIAAKLFLTPRGVEFHLTSIYRKLGIAGRRELAALPTA
jgi:DNA-binding CsgD family transcriptional regulator